MRLTRTATRAARPPAEPALAVSHAADATHSGHIDASFYSLSIESSPNRHPRANSVIGYIFAFTVNRGATAMISARAALEALRAGNRRFVSELGLEAGTARARRRELPAGQEPFAIILGCSDARVPAEIIFDQGLGDLFVIRVAGNIVAPSQVGSVEFAAEAFGTRLVVVLGHTQCGAIQATLQQRARPSREQSRNLGSIVDRIRPAVEGLVERGPPRDMKTLEQLAVRANIRMSADHLRHGSKVLEQLTQHDGLMVVGAEYSLETGVVDFFDGVPLLADDTE